MKICFKLGIADIFYLAVAFHNEVHVSLGPGPVDRVSHQEDEFDPRHDLMNEFDYTIASIIGRRRQSDRAVLNLEITQIRSHAK